MTRDEEGEVQVSERQKALAERLSARDDRARTISRLLAMARSRGRPNRARFGARIAARSARLWPASESGINVARAARSDSRAAASIRRANDRTRLRAATPYRGAQRDGGDWVSFRITWGGDQGADARKLLAMPVAGVKSAAPTWAPSKSSEIIRA